MTTNPDFQPTKSTTNSSTSTSTATSTTTTSSSGAGGGGGGGGAPPPHPGRHEGRPSTTWTPPVDVRMLSLCCRGGGVHHDPNPIGLISFKCINHHLACMKPEIMNGIIVIIIFFFRVPTLLVVFHRHLNQ